MDTFMDHASNLRISDYGIFNKHVQDACAAIAERARSEERERCAKIVEDMAREDELICGDCSIAAARKIRGGDK